MQRDLSKLIEIIIDTPLGNWCAYKSIGPEGLLMLCHMAKYGIAISGCPKINDDIIEIGQSFPLRIASIGILIQHQDSLVVRDSKEETQGIFNICSPYVKELDIENDRLEKETNGTIWTKIEGKKCAFKEIYEITGEQIVTFSIGSAKFILIGENREYRLYKYEMESRITTLLSGFFKKGIYSYSMRVEEQQDIERPVDYIILENKERIPIYQRKMSGNELYTLNKQRKIDVIVVAGAHLRLVKMKKNYFEAMSDSMEAFFARYGIGKYTNKSYKGSVDSSSQDIVKTDHLESDINFCQENSGLLGYTTEREEYEIFLEKWYREELKTEVPLERGSEYKSDEEILNGSSSTEESSYLNGTYTRGNSLVDEEDTISTIYREIEQQYGEIVYIEDFFKSVFMMYHSQSQLASDQTAKIYRMLMKITKNVSIYSQRQEDSEIILERVWEILLEGDECLSLKLAVMKIISSRWTRRDFKCAAQNNTKQLGSLYTCENNDYQRERLRIIKNMQCRKRERIKDE